MAEVNDNGSIQLFEDQKIRTAWDAEKEEWYFSIIDVISVLTGTANPRRYWSDLKRKLKAEGANELYEKIVQLKMLSSDGKRYKTDVANTEQLLRIIQSIPSPKAEPFKAWLAMVGKERIEETIDPEQAIDRALDTYLKKGVYSNTGGQSSKSTPTGAIAQFAAGGKETKKKDMASIAMSYGYVYVAQISMGADFNQTVKAIAEAEAYPGPSLIIAYAPCINHGIKKGMSKAQTEEELAVKCGYWHNFRFNPAAENKFSLDSKTPDMENYMDFLNGEVRYNSLQRQNPEKAARLFAKNESEAQARYEYLQKLITLYGADKKED